MSDANNLTPNKETKVEPTASLKDNNTMKTVQSAPVITKVEFSAGKIQHNAEKRHEDKK